MAEGWIKIHRKIRDWRWYHKPEMVLLWIELLFKANYHNGEFETVELKPGQAIIGLPALSKSTGLTIQTLRTCLKRLKSTGEITIKSTNKFSILTILKYSEYQQATEPDQQANQQANQQATNRQLTGNQQATNNIQERKNIRKKESNINIEWTDPSEEQTKELEEKFSKSLVETQLPMMRDWAASKKARKFDWQAFRRNWLRKAANENQDRLPLLQGARPPQMSKYEKTKQSLASLYEWADEEDKKDEQEAGLISAGGNCKRLPEPI